MATKRDLLRMIRMFCSECTGGPRATADIWPIKNPSEVADCTAPECIWFAYRFGHDPDKPILSPRQRAQIAKMRSKLVQAKKAKEQKND